MPMKLNHLPKVEKEMTSSRPLSLGKQRMQLKILQSLRNPFSVKEVFKNPNCLTNGQKEKDLPLPCGEISGPEGRAGSASFPS